MRMPVTCNSVGAHSINLQMLGVNLFRPFTLPNEKKLKKKKKRFSIFNKLFYLFYFAILIRIMLTRAFIIFVNRLFY